MRTEATPTCLCVIGHHGERIWTHPECPRCSPRAGVTDADIERWRRECADYADATGGEQYRKAVVLSLCAEVVRLKLALIEAQNPGIDIERVRTERGW